jgi:hypothetical protein
MVLVFNWEQGVVQRLHFASRTKDIVFFSSLANHQNMGVLHVLALTGLMLLKAVAEQQDAESQP